MSPDRPNPSRRPYGSGVYQSAFAAAATRIEAERAHRLGLAAIRAGGRLPVVTGLVTRAAAGAARSRETQSGGARSGGVTALGRRFRSPLGLAAGFDKDGTAVAGLAALGFGFVEVGTVTPRPQPGNPAPRLFRLPADRALVNRLGFNNAGADAVAARLGRLRARPSALPDGFVVGVNIGRNRDTADAGVIEDYATAARIVAPVADYLVVNVSSPNTPGLPDLQAVDRLRPVVAAVRVQTGPLPVLVKIAPDLAEADVDALVELAVTEGLAGVVATNTTVSREGLRSNAGEVAAAGSGGLSGTPLRARALAVVQRVATRSGGRLTVVAAGGIGSADDARRALDAGASLVQAYTGFVYGGPAWPRRVSAALADRPPV